MNSLSRTRYVIYGPNIHQGGGKTLLLPLLEILEAREDVVFVLDKRLDISARWQPVGAVIRVKPSFFSRLSMELSLYKMIKPDDQLLCMGNLPPIFARSKEVIVFVQNCYLVNKELLKDFSFFVRSRIRFERWWLRFSASNVTRYIVQTKTMAHLLKKTLNRVADVLPYADLTYDASNKAVASSVEKQYDFIYVASGEPHKNHKQLLLAWIRLAQLNQFPSLCLTLSRNQFPELYQWIGVMVKQHCLNIEIVSELSHQQVEDMYKKSKALIYPSKLESFGLPLIEAVSMGLPVLASDLSYVYDVITPSMVFNPNSSESIALSVMNFTYQSASFSVEFNTSAGFLNEVFGSAH